VALGVGLDVGESSSEETGGPLLGQWPGLAKDDRHGRVANLNTGQQLGDEARRHMLELEDVGVAVLDHQRCAWQGRQLGEQIRQAAVDQAAGQISECLALHRSDQPAVHLDPVVAGGQGSTRKVGLLPREAVRVRSRVSTSTSGWRWPEARRVGTRIPGRALRVVRVDCQKIPSRPPLRRVKMT
jgi:hypothetical protein